MFKLFIGQKWVTPPLFPSVLQELVCPGAESRWSLAELIHAVILMAQAHALCSFVWGCGLNPEPDHSGGYTFQPPSPTHHQCSPHSPAHEDGRQEVSRSSCQVASTARGRRRVVGSCQLRFTSRSGLVASLAPHVVDSAMEKQFPQKLSSISFSPSSSPPGGWWCHGGGGVDEEDGGAAAAGGGVHAGGDGDSLREGEEWEHPDRYGPWTRVSGSFCWHVTSCQHQQTDRLHVRLLHFMYFSK